MSLLRSVLFFSLQIFSKNDWLVSSLDLREPCVAFAPSLKKQERSQIPVEQSGV